MMNLIKISVRDLLRSRRRSLLTILAIVVGVGLLIFVSGFYAGTLDGSLNMSIHLQTSHLQLRAESYDESKLGLAWSDLLADPAGLSAQIDAVNDVQSASPVLWSSGMLLAGEEAVGVQITGVDPDAVMTDPIRQAIVDGALFAGDDRDGVLIGSEVAGDLGIGVGQKITLVTNTSDGDNDQAVFIVRGLYDTGVSNFDRSTVFMALSKAQAFTGAGERASAIRVLLDDRERADDFAAAFQQAGIQALTWRDLNALIMTSIKLSGVLYPGAVPDCAGGGGGGDRQHAVDVGLRAHARDRDSDCAGDETPPGAGDVPDAGGHSGRGGRGSWRAGGLAAGQLLRQGRDYYRA